MTHLWVRAEQRPNEERVGITPDGVAALVKAGIRVTVEESSVRAIPIAGYRKAGAAIAPVAGAIADKRGPELVIRAGALLVIASFLAMMLAPGSLIVLIAATIVFDLGVQACLISHQTIIYGLNPAARSRLNAVLVSSMFFGMSAGAALASRALARYGFPGVAALSALAAASALAVRLVPAADRRR